MFRRNAVIGLALAVTAVAPAAAFAKRGADDPGGRDDIRDRGGQRDSGSSSDDGSSSGGSSKGGNRRVTRATGSCTGRASAKLKAKPDDGRLEVEFEVDQNRNGVPWKVVIRRNGRIAVSTTATTRAPSGSFSVERKIADGAGTDRISARATSPSGQVCTASLSL